MGTGCFVVNLVSLLLFVGSSIRVLALDLLRVCFLAFRVFSPLIMDLHTINRISGPSFMFVTACVLLLFWLDPVDQAN